MSTTSPSNDAVKPFARNTLFDVSSMTAIVTGGGTGIGLMIAQALVANGAKVYITGRRKEKLDAAIRAHSDLSSSSDGQNTNSGRFVALPGDVTDKNDVLRLVKEVEAQEPNGIQLLVNNAGIARDDKTRFTANNGPPDMTDAKAVSEHFLRSDPEDWDQTFRTNVTANFFMSMAFLPLLAKGSPPPTSAASTPVATSSIINISSISGSMKGHSGGLPAYAASKAAATHLSRVLATTLKDTGVRVQTIAPGLFPSEMTTGKSNDHDGKSKFERDIGNPMRRAGHESDIAATVLFLAGPGGAFYNGQIMYPDGGVTLVSPAVNN